MRTKHTETNPTIVFLEPKKVAIQEYPIPTPQEGELLIENKLSLISTGTELTIFSGNFPPDSAWARMGRFPFVPGYANVGDVIDIGEGVSKEWLGKRVASRVKHQLFGCAEVSTVSPVPDTVSDASATFHTLAQTVSNSVRRGGVSWGDAVVVYGAGILGQLATRFCRLCGARPVVVVDLVKSRLERLPDDIAIHPVDASQEDVVAAVENVTKERFANVVFEATGNPQIIPDEFKVLRRHGRFVVLSSPRGKTEFDFHDLCNSPSFTIIGTHGSSQPPYETWDTPWTKLRSSKFFFDLVSDGELELESLISHREPFTEASNLYRMLLEDRSQAMGVLLEWSGG
ncbi:zinc-binding alcohol dehydrogenase [Chloroflexi bacterium TSY]|nr:zinc-binding alcohol dehydrogenase [Chloroflexi bacterium TSY]